MSGKKRAANEGTLTYDSKRERWVGRLPRSVDPKRPAVYGKTQDEVRRKLRKAMAAAETGVQLDERTRLGEYLEEWLTSTVRARVQTGRLAARTAAGYESHVRVHLAPKLGRKRLQALKVSDVERFLSNLQAAGLSPGSAKSVRATLSKALTDAMRDELVVRNVAQLAECPTVERRDPSAFTADEFDRLVKACHDDESPYGLAVLFAIFTGLRASELRGLRWSDVDLEDGTFQVHKGVHYVTPAAERVVGETGMVESKPKTRRSGDTTPMASAAVDLLRYVRRRQASETVVSLHDDRYVFTSPAGTRLDPSNMSKALTRLLKAADVPTHTADGRGRGWHEARRSFATRLRDAGVPLEDTMRLGRWSSPTVLLASYAATPNERLRAAAEAAGR